MFCLHVQIIKGKKKLRNIHEFLLMLQYIVERNKLRSVHSYYNGIMYSPSIVQVTVTHQLDFGFSERRELDEYYPDIFAQNRISLLA